MYWADKVAKEIIDSGKFKPYVVDDMFTPSGFPHIGSLRGPIVHDLIFKALKDQNVEVKFTFVINDFDPIDGLPPAMQEEFSKYMGLPLRKAPSPVEGFESFAAYFADDYKNSMKSLGIEPEFLSSWDMYHGGKFDEAIKLALDNAEIIQDIYQEVSGSKKREAGWLPLQVICENCGKVGTTRVYDWDGETVAYKCEKELVKWAEGCSNEGRISPFGGNGKLPWKVDWPSHWMVIGVTIEGAGKDHSSAGGSRDIARELVKQVFKIEEPFNLPYEFFLIGGKKMASSKGLGLKARELTELLPLELGRFLFCRSDYKQQVNFDPNGTMAVPNLFDEYDKCFTEFVADTNSDFARAFELSHIGKLPEKEKIFLPRFRDVANFIQQPGVDIYKKFSEAKGSDLNQIEKNILVERVKYAKIWLEKFAPDNLKFSLNENSEKSFSLSSKQKEYLEKVIDLINSDSSADDLQTKLYELTKELGINAKLGFQAIYQVLIGKDFGPKAGAFIRQYEKDEVIAKIQKAL
jgi:lysyl-tRNA synthetase, class I